MKSSFENVFFIVLALSLTNLGFAMTTSAEHVADVTIDSGGIYVRASVPGATFMMLRVADPQGQMIFDQSSDGSPIIWSPPDVTQDGIYSYEVRVGVAGRRGERGESQQPEPPVRRLIQSGTVFIESGAIVPPSAEETSLLQDILSVGELAFAKLMDYLVPPVFADQVINDDLIVTFSECVGNDCVNGENFGFDTIRLKENNLRIKFQDTSNTANYPTNDWQITINSSVNGGASYFAIDDIDGGRTPFTIEAGAPTNSFYVDDYGRLGVGTSVPVVEIHTVDSDTPTLRLEQDSSGGWPPQTWDVAGNESNFFIRDATNGSQLPFRIQPGAPHDSLTLKSDGKVGMGTWYPSASMHMQRYDGAAKILVEELSGTAQSRTMLELRNNGSPRVQLTNSIGKTWSFGTSMSDMFTISCAATGGSEMSITKDGRVKMGPGGAPNFFLTRNGNLIIAGTLRQNSDVNAKENITQVNGDLLLARLREVPISTWNYKTDEAQARHMGPMAQDFYAVFGLGGDDRHIAPMDAAGVSLAAAKALQEEIRKRDAWIARLEERLSDLEQRLYNLSKGRLQDNQPVALKDD
jgi:hypothetical protein